MSSNTDKVNIMVPIGCRSDEVLSSPIISRLEAVEEFDARGIPLYPSNFQDSYDIMEKFIQVESPDFVLLVGDRIEMCAAAAACFHNNVKTGHVYAGVINSMATFDDFNRHAMTLWSDIQFCEDARALSVVIELTSAVGVPCNAYNVGITHFDDVDMDGDSPFTAPFSEFDLVLYNPVTLGECTKEMDKDIDKIVKSVKNNVVLVDPNEDPGNDYAFEVLHESLFNAIGAKNVGLAVLHKVPHSDFLRLMKACAQFITNSSAAIYEAPVLLEPEQIVHIGNRNWARAKGPFETGASDKIVDILKAKLLDN